MPVPVPCCERPPPKKSVAYQPERFKILCLRQTSLSDDLGKIISRDVMIMTKLGWEYFVNQRRGRGNFASLGASLHL